MEEMGLAPAWRRWATEALIRGSSPREIAEALMTEGVDEAIAVREMAILSDALAPVADRYRRMDLLMRMLKTVGSGELERRRLCGAEEFHARHFTRYRPVVFAGGCAEMEAADWSFEQLRERFGDRSIDVGFPDTQRMPLRDAIDAFVADAPPELYVMSHNAVLSGPLAELKEELRPLPAFMHPSKAPETANMWMGPASTDSPLHHDTTHVYFCQFVGRKRYQLVAPWEPGLLEAEIVRGWDSTFDVDHPGEAHVHDVVLEPGDALFIPTGWWHRVTALTPSISVSMRDFRWPSDHSWYAPGVPEANPARRDG